MSGKCVFEISPPLREEKHILGYLVQQCPSMHNELKSRTGADEFGKWQSVSVYMKVLLRP